MLQEAGLIERASPRVMVVRRRTEDHAYRELQRALRRRNPTFHHLHEALLVLEPELAQLAAMPWRLTARTATSASTTSVT